MCSSSSPQHFLSQAVLVEGVGDHVILDVAPDRPECLHCHTLFLVAAAPVNIVLKDGASGQPLAGPFLLLQGGSLVLEPQDAPWFATSAGSGLTINVDSPARIGGMIQYSRGV